MIALELLCAAQGIEFHRPLKSSAPLEEVMANIRTQAAPWDGDRYFVADIEPVLTMVASGALRRFVPGLLPDGD